MVINGEPVPGNGFYMVLYMVVNGDMLAFSGALTYKLKCNFIKIDVLGKV